MFSLHHPEEATVKRHSDSRECSDNDDEAWAYGPKLPPPITATCADKPGNDDNEKHESNNRQDAAYGPSLPLSSSSSSFSGTVCSGIEIIKS